APYIDRTNLKNIVIRSGQTVRFDVDVKGEPPPTIAWLHSEQPIQPSDHLKIETEDYHTLFVLSKAKRKDTGKYTITANNDSGKDEVTVEVTVLSKPSKPKGPLEVSDVHAEGCKLKWEKPEDDGGEPIQQYAIEKMDTETGRWVPVMTTKEPEAEITGLVPGKEYKFRVKAVNPEGESEPLETEKATLAKNPFDEPGKPGKPSAKNWDKHFVDLTWEPPKNDGGAPITSYIIEKKDKYSTKWQKVSEIIGEKCEARAPDLIENMEYQFRVRAVNKAGPGNPSDPSDFVTAKPRFLAPKIEKMRDVKIHAGQTVKFNVKVIGEPLPKKTWCFGETILKSDGNITIDTDSEKAFLTISNAQRKDSGCYSLKAENSSGKDEATAEVTVIDKPSTPEGPLEISDVHAEGCKLKWKPPKDDGGEPLDHYVVEKMDTESGRWLPVGRTSKPEMEVSNLTPGQEYKFRVRAVNPEGESEPLMAAKSIIAKDPYDPPGQPGTPEVKDWDKDHVDLKWTPPVKDGGAPIKGYVIERKEKFDTRWIKAATIDGNVCEGRVPDLITGDTYQFRVRAVNAAGPGEPSEATKPVVAKPRKLPPRIERRSLRPITVKAGQPFDFDVKIIGEPPPTVTWKLKDKPVTEGPNMTITNVPYNSKLVCDKSLRKDSGIYHIIAVNQYGQDEAEVEVTVLAKPSKPEGPLEVSDIHKNGCKLKWNKPKDDGGEPIDHYLIEKLDPETGSWVPVGKSHVPEMEVTGLTPGKPHQFRVKAVNKEGVSEPLETISPIVPKDPYNPPGEPGCPEATDWNKDHVDLKWKPPDKDGGAPISRYIIEKKKKGSPTWEKAAEVPGDQCKGTAPFLEEGKEYEFRVIAVNKAGPGEPSKASKPVIAKPRLLAPSIDRKNLKDMTIKAGLPIKFDVSVSGEPPPTVSWNLNGDILKPDNHREIENVDYNSKLTVRRTTRADCGEYTILAVNSSGKDSAVVKVTIVDKPTPPEGPLEVSDVHKEGCKLKWKRPKDDGGVPLEGYEVEKMDSDSGVWVPVGKTKEPGMDVTGLTPGKDYKFRVRALNKEGESEPLETEKAITAKNPYDEPSQPGKPEVTDWDKDHVDIKWTPPENDGGSPITGYVVEKKDKFGDWEKALEVPATQTNATVPDLMQGQPYEFRVRAVNKAGPGVPSEASAPVVTKPRRLPPKIDRTSLYKVRIKAGQSFNFDVNVVGEPAPEVTWKLRNRNVTSSDRIKVINEPNNTKLSVRQARREDCGTYTITAVNEHGKDEAQVEVVVLDKPSPPGGPLKVDDVHAEGCTLKWNPPADDGGTPVDHYTVEKMDPETGKWLPVGETLGPENSMKVKGLQPGKKYKFRVRAANRQGESEPLETDKAIEAKNPFDEPGKPGTPEIEDYDKDFVKLKWKPPTEDGGSPLTGYVVEKKDKYNCSFSLLDVPGAPQNMNISNITKDSCRLTWKPPKDDGGCDISHYIVEKKDVETGRWMPVGETIDTNIRADKLIENHDYTFRVKAVNREGESPWLIGREPITAKNPYDQPDKPTAPEVVDWDKDHVDLEWRPPRRDGGAPITAYVVEKKSKLSPVWEEALRVPGEATKATVPDLKEGEEYEFRIVAVNKAGPSEPSDPSQSVVAKPRYLAPSLDKAALHDMKIRVGRPISYTIPVRGEPTPSVTWHINDKSVLGNPRIEQTFTVGQTMLDIRSSIRSDSGRYTLILENSSGKTSASATVTVMDRPSPPEGPLNISDVTRNSAQLSWKVPKDDGGSPIKHYVVEKMDVSRGTWVEVGTPTQLTYKVPKLVHKKTYEFRVRAVNEISDSDPLAGDKPITAKDPCEQPGAPGKPKVTDWDKDHVDLEWAPPKDDGGSPITGYIIQKKERGTPLWTKAAEVPSSATKATVPDLIEGNDYEFRVIAKNKGGDGEPSEPSDLVTAKPRFLAPKILTPMTEVKVKVGRTLHSEIKFIGQPAPEVLWMQNGKKLTSDDRITISAFDDYTVVNVVDAKRSDSGPYVLTVTNDSGKDSGTLTVIILDKPLAPEGPLNVDEVDKDHVVLSWKPPKDVGGSDLTGYIVEKRDKTRDGTWVPAVLHVPPNSTKCTVPKLMEGTAYEFRVMAENPQGVSEPLTTTKPITAKSPYGVPGTPGQPQPVDHDRDFIKIKWTPPRSDGGSPIQGYDIERRDTKANRWVRITKTPVRGTEYNDDTVTDGHQYEYRVIAKNAAGPSEPSQASKPIAAKPMKEKPKLHLDSGRNIRVRAGEPLNVSIPMTGAPEPAVKWTINDKPIPVTNRIITESGDENVSLSIPVSQRGDSGKYTITAKNPYGEDSADINVLVYDKPSSPRGPLEYPSTTNSSVTLQWKSPEDDGGSAITGYQIEKCEFGSDRWLPVPGYCPTTTYTVRNLEEGKQYKFRVSAENMYGVSEPLEGKPVTVKNPFDTPDAPSQPKVTDFGPSFADITWKPPTNDGGRPVTGYIVEKREKGSPEWTPVNTHPTPSTDFTVPNLTEGQTYEFRIVPVNEGGRGKPSRPSQPVTAQERKYVADAPDMPRVDKVTKNSVTLAWKKPANDGGSKIKGYLVEKKPKGAKDWDIVNTIPHPDTTYTVPNLTEGQEYEFRVIAVNDVGDSPPSHPCPMVLVEDQPDKPRIDAGNVRDIVIKAGQEFNINVPFSGFPKPTATWSKNDFEVNEKDPRIFNKVGDDYAVLALSDAKRSDSGQYKLFLKNKSGFDTAYCKVTVLDHPGPPENLRGEDIEGESLTLKWLPPKDNGGSEITNYMVEKKEVGATAWTRVSSYVTTTACRVRNLMVGHKYDFRVMAENQYGTSDPAVTSEPIMAKLPFNPPSAPGIPRFVESSEDSITLSWTKPRNDGGSPVTGYILEKRKAGDENWTRASMAVIPDLTYRVSGLKENCDYEFRVCAVNEAGPGPYSSASDSIKARAPPAAPMIDASFAMRDIVVPAGQEFNIRVPYSGNPTPHASWTINGKDLLPDNRVYSEVNVAFTVLTNKCAKREDSGKYTLKLANGVGSDSASCKVLVVDKPGPPQGPLQVTDITPETCSLSWRPPLDDGGSPILNYVVEKQDPTTKIWTKLSGFVRGCHYDVMGLEPNKKYNFRVSAENEYGTGQPLETEKAITAKFPFDVPNPPGAPTIVDWDAHSVSLVWERPSSDGGSKIQGYIVEYRDPLDGNWIKANNFLVKDTTFTVPDLLENHEYEFRVKAKNAAGLSKPSQPTATLKLRPKFTAPSPPENLKVTRVGRSYVDLKWDKPQSDGGSKITGYIVEKREKGSSFWFKANDYSVIDCEYTVLNLTEGSECDFRVFAVNAAGKSEPVMTSGPVKIQEFSDGVKPEFVRKLLNKNTNLNKSVTLECEAIGKPHPVAQWFKNGREIHPGGRIKALEKEDGVYKLQITEVWDTDDGDYTCEVNNSLGSDRCTARLNVAAPPKIERCPNEVCFPEHDNGKVKIFFSGTGPFEVNLFKHGLEVNENEHMKMTIFDDYVIIFLREALKNDEGKYKLTVRNESGVADASFSMIVTGLPGPPEGPLEVSDITQHTASLSWRPPAHDGGSKITHYVVERKETSHSQWVIATSYSRDTNCTVQGLTEGGEYLFRVMAVNENGQGLPLEGTNPIIAKNPFDPPSAPGVPTVTEVGGDFVNLSWEKPESDGGARIQGYWIDKREHGTQTWQRVNQFLCITTQINISNLIEDRQYEFRVFAVNEAGISPPSVNSSSVKIKDPLTSSPPEFIVPLRQIVAVENKSAEFVCKVTGNPKPQVTWYKGMRELFEGGKYSMIREGDTHTLMISEVYGEDADEYTCRAVNRGGARTSRAELIIKTAPHINVPPRFRELACFEKGENIVLKIPFTGFPKPTIKWMHEGEVIESGAHYDIKVSERHAILMIRDVSKADNGPYRLVAENELGVDSAIIKIQISDKPDPPRFPVIENIYEDSVTLSWKPPLWDGSSNINNYLVEKREVPMSSWIRCGTSRFCNMTITGLNSSKDYEFRVYAENVFGRSDPSEPTQLITTKASGKQKAKKKNYMVDASGKKIRGKSEGRVKNYDQFVFDMYEKYIPQPVDIKTSSVYDFYDILEEIGVGAFGVVHRCRERKTGNIFAAKFIPVSQPAEKAVIKKEIDIMNQLHHPKLIKLHDAFEDDDEMVLIYEFMAGDELFEKVTADDYKMSEAEVINYMRQICEGVKHMHEKNILHLDIKPENIMCQTRTGTDIKLVDFGLATKLDPNEIVKISTGTAEFAAPEIVDREPIGFYTDMWAVGVLAYVLGFSYIKLAGVLNYFYFCRKRMTSHECLEHPWLKGDIKDAPTIPIPSRKYMALRDRIRAKYGDYWDACLLPFGHIANYSSLRKLQKDKYRIQDFYIDSRQAAPRFVIRPQSTFAYEGQAAKFYCRVIAAAPATVTWFRENEELRQSVKFMKRYEDNDFYFIINRCKIDDKGEYIIKAENHYGFREEPVFLNVQSIPKEIPKIKLDEPIRSSSRDSECKNIHGNMLLQIKWFKNGKELSKYDYSIGFADSVVSLELPSCTVDDAGKYTCRAVNSLGEDETTCFIIVEDRRGPSIAQSPVVVSPGATTPRIPTPTKAPFASSISDTYKRDYKHDYSQDFNFSTSRTSDYSDKYSSSVKKSSDYSYSSKTQDSSQSYSSLKSSSKSTTAQSLAAASSKLSADSEFLLSPKRAQKAYGKKEGTSPQRSRTATKELEIPEDKAMTPPSFKQGLQDLKIRDGEPLILKCVIVGDPEPKVEWLRQGKVLHSSEIIDLKYKNGVATLMIAEAFPEDEGEYICKASNPLDTISTKCKLTILPMEGAKTTDKKGESKPPRITEHLKSLMVKDGEPVTLQCAIRSSSKFDVVWLHNDKEIKPSKDFDYRQYGDTYQLVINEIFPEDGGIYTCEAFNDGGEAFSSCTLIVLVPKETLKGPGFAEFPQSATVIENQPVTFKLKTEKDALTVRWLKDGKLFEEESPRHQITQKGKTFILQIPAALATDIGQYTAVAVDSSGECSTTFSLNVLVEGDL
ncbi:twitchin-like, partial [Limulus polyphemus]|uniref:Twitchin-like n=1 Tax=Limulus polyphemus TaxID=6850 RepID=A0ABM1BP12_LIMPO